MKMSNRHVTRKNKWSIDFTTQPKGVSMKTKTKEYPDPVGYSENKISQQPGAQSSSDTQLISKRSWNIATGPVKQLPMNLFIMYMSGNSISIFPIMIIGMMVFRPIKAMMAYKGTFQMLNADSKYSIIQKIAWVLGNLLGIVVAIWKCQSMGLLPTAPSDWLAFKEHRERVEYVIGGMS